eukprot:IDg23014t1
MGKSKNTQSGTTNISRNDLGVLQDHITRLIQKYRELTDRSESTEATVDKLRKEVHADRTNRVFNTVSRVLLFAKPKFIRMITAPCPILDKLYHNLCAPTSLVSGLMESEDADCTLNEFQEWARFCANNESVQCQFVPTEFHVLHSRPPTNQSLEIVFNNFPDMCAALDVPTDTTENAMLRVKRDKHRRPRSVLLVGTHLFCNHDLSQPATQWIFLSSTVHSANRTGRYHCLRQPRAVWSEGSWESNFQYVSFERQPKPVIPKEMKLESKEPLQFRAIWSRMNEACSSDVQTDPRTIPGCLRTCVPFVVMRDK